MTCGVVCVRAGLADASDVSGPTQTWTKFERQMGHTRTVCPFGSDRWAAFFAFFCPRGHKWTAGGRMGSPARDALSVGTSILRV
jgi:hypothetical protein